MSAGCTHTPGATGRVPGASGVFSVSGIRADRRGALLWMVNRAVWRGGRMCDGCAVRCVSQCVCAGSQIESGLRCTDSSKWGFSKETIMLPESAALRLSRQKIRELWWVSDLT